MYLARDVRHHRHVAVKVVRPELTAILGAERFLKEIEVTANLQYPNILPLYDSGEADSFLYYVMPFVEGESFRDRLNREKQLGIEDSIAIAASVAVALTFAHERGVVHRDIKPENMLIQAGQAMIADFGIALAVSHVGGTRLTETGLSIGTPPVYEPGTGHRGPRRRCPEPHLRVGRGGVRDARRRTAAFRTLGSGHLGEALVGASRSSPPQSGFRAAQRRGRGDDRVVEDAR